MTVAFRGWLRTRPLKGFAGTEGLPWQQLLKEWQEGVGRVLSDGQKAML